MSDELPTASIAMATAAALLEAATPAKTESHWSPPDPGMLVGAAALMEELAVLSAVGEENGDPAGLIRMAETLQTRAAGIAAGLGQQPSAAASGRPDVAGRMARVRAASLLEREGRVAEATGILAEEARDALTTEADVPAACLAAALGCSWARAELQRSMEDVGEALPTTEEAAAIGRWALTENWFGRAGHILHHAIHGAIPRWTIAPGCDHGLD